jgi:hypothetical protein
MGKIFLYKIDFQSAIFLDKNRKGLSTIVTTLLIVVLSLVAVGLVWGFVSNMIRNQIKTSESCYGNSDKVRINEQYTCYEVRSGEYNLRVSLSIGDTSVDKVVVYVSSASAVKSYTITNTEGTVAGLLPIPYLAGNVNVKLPGKNSGLTYNATAFSSIIDSVEIAPIIGGTQCDVSASLSQIESCALLV